MENQTYAKKSLWKWIIIYLAIALIAYGIIYYTIAATRKPEPTPAPTPTQTPSPTLSPSPEMTIKLDELNSSGESGEAKIKEENGKAIVTISLTGFTKDIPQPAHIHTGDCPGLGAIKYPLTNVLNGSSATTLDVTLADLKQNLPLAINIHESAINVTSYTACGELSN